MLTNRKENIDLAWHRDINNFWPKLCDGLPHRSGHSITGRAKNVLTDSFLETLNWEQLDNEVQEKYYEPETYDIVKLRKWRKFFDEGQRATDVARIMGITETKASAILGKLKRSEKRDDPTMIHKFYVSATSSGLNPDKIREHVFNDDEIELDNLRQLLRIKELSLHLNISEIRCIELLKIVLKKILDKFRESKKGGATDDMAWSEAMCEVSEKPELDSDQCYKAIEIFCQNATNEDTTLTLRRSAQMKEFLEKKLFIHLLHSFRLNVKLHLLLWSYKRLEVWNKLPVGEGQTRYEAVLEFELANPLVSKMTQNFLKYRKVAEWIMEPRPPISQQEAVFESFILYTLTKYSGEFKFPARLSHLFSKRSSDSIQSILAETMDPENAEYVSEKRAKTQVEEASGKKILVEIRNKNIMMKHGDSEDSEDETKQQSEMV